jgi:hypothetical protein
MTRGQTAWIEFRVVIIRNKYPGYGGKKVLIRRIFFEDVTRDASHISPSMAMLVITMLMIVGSVMAQSYGGGGGGGGSYYSGGSSHYYFFGACQNKACTASLWALLVVSLLSLFCHLGGHRILGCCVRRMCKWAQNHEARQFGLGFYSQPLADRFGEYREATNNVKYNTTVHAVHLCTENTTRLVVLVRYGQGDNSTVVPDVMTMVFDVFQRSGSWTMEPVNAPNGTDDKHGRFFVGTSLTDVSIDVDASNNHLLRSCAFKFRKQYGVNGLGNTKRHDVL